MPFAVTHTSGPKAIKSLSNKQQLSPRRDLDMKVQRRTAYRDSRVDLQQAHVKDYETTVGTRTKHANFLYQILNEIQRYQVEAYGHRIPDLALAILAEEMADEMANTKVDNYATCLVKIGRRRVYSSDFIITAIEMVEEYHKNRHIKPSASATSLASSQALTDDDNSE